MTRLLFADPTVQLVVLLMQGPHRVVPIEQLRTTARRRPPTTAGPWPLRRWSLAKPMQTRPSGPLNATRDSVRARARTTNNTKRREWCCLSKPTHNIFFDVRYLFM